MKTSSEERVARQPERIKTHFTPGPWRRDMRLIKADGETIVGIYSLRGLRDREEDGNEDLVAAAPAMYEALANLENDDNSIPAHAWKLVQDALALTRGETK